MKKLATLVIIIALIAGTAGYWAFFSDKSVQGKQTKPSEPAKVTRGALLIKVEATGSVVPEQEVEIKCKASGEVIKLPVDVSDKVKKGDLLLQLDPVDEQRTVKKSEVNLAVTEAQLAQTKLALEIAERELASEKLRAEAALDSATINARDAASRLKRLEQLQKKKIASDEELDAARTSHAQAESNLKDAQARIDDLKTEEVRISSKRHDITIAERKVEADRIALEDAKERLAETTVRSPIDGVVATKDVQVGQIIASGVSNVGGGTSVLTLADMNRIYVLVSVDESDIGSIKTGQKATITVDAYPDRTLHGEVVRIATKGETTSNVVTFEVKVEVLGEMKKLLKPEMTANVAIITVDKKDALLVPVTAVKRRGPKSFIMIKSSGSEPERRTVTVGESDGKFIEVLEGVSAGEEIESTGKTGSGWKKSNSSNKNNRRPRGPPL